MEGEGAPLLALGAQIIRAHMGEREGDGREKRPCSSVP